jgi:hypothetical protein
MCISINQSKMTTPYVRFRLPRASPPLDDSELELSESPDVLDPSESLSESESELESELESESLPELELSDESSDMSESLLSDLLA